MHRLLATAAVLVAARTAAADCVHVGLETRVITKQDAIIPGDGGVLVAAVAAARDTDETDAGNHPEWRLRVGTKLTAPAMDLLAPGLYRYRVALGRASDPVMLEDDRQATMARVFGSRAKPVRYAPPAVRGVAHFSSWQGAEAVAVLLDKDLPANAYALVIADEDGRGLSWHALDGASPRSPIQFVFKHDRCDPVPRGARAAHPGDAVTVFWVDAEGRSSERTAAITVEARR